MEKIFINVDGKMVEDLLGLYRLDQTYIFRKSAVFKHYFEHWVYNKNKITVEQFALEFHQFVKELAEHAAKPLPELDNPYISELHQKLQSNLEIRFSLAEYAEKTPYSENHLIRLFKQTYKTTPYEFRLSQKFEQAKNLLIHTNLPIKTISSQLGFCNVFHFSKYFKARLHQSPKNFRLNNKSMSSVYSP